MYSDKLLQYFRAPNRAGTLPPPALQAEEMHPVCGDILRLSIRIEDGLVRDAAFQAKGCTASIAAGEAAAQWMIGKPLAEVRAVTPELIEELLDGLPAESKHAAALAASVCRRVCP
jgi:nitrogen fixation NifU-like protein